MPVRGTLTWKHELSFVGTPCVTRGSSWTQAPWSPPHPTLPLQASHLDEQLPTQGVIVVIREDLRQLLEHALAVPEHGELRLRGVVCRYSGRDRAHDPQ